MKITDEILEQYKQKYPKEWKKFQYNEKLWRQWVAAREKERQAKEKITKITSKDRARAFIILATGLMRVDSQTVKEATEEAGKDWIKWLIENKHINMVQKKGGRDFDYSPLVLEEIEKISQKL